MALDFVVVMKKKIKDRTIVYPNFIIKQSCSDLMIRGGDFYAVWCADRNVWSTNEQDVIDMVDVMLEEYVTEHDSEFASTPEIHHMWDSSCGVIDAWHKYCQKQMRDHFKPLDENIIFSNTEVTKKSYASKRLNYPLEEGNIEAFDKLMSTLYDEKERHKIEWSIGSIVTGDSKTIQKFIVMYGSAGTGKSTVLNIIQKLFEGYYSVFDAKALGSSSNSFALEAFKTNPLVAIQHDGDLSKIEDNTRINSLVSHEVMTVNEKFKSTYATKFNSFLYMGTNKPVKITDGRSGLIRRLIDVSPSGRKLDPKEYKTIMSKINFELGAIAYHCKEVYLANPGAYDDYIPTSMLGASNDFYNYMLESYSLFEKQDGCSLKQAWELYKTYCDEAKVAYPYSQRNFKEELKNYFWDYEDRHTDEEGNRIRSYFSGFRTDKFESETRYVETKKIETTGIEFSMQPSIFDRESQTYPAQYANADGYPSCKWDNCKTTLADIDTSKLHYVKVPMNHIVIDFDIKGPDGKKNFALNNEAASKWPATYAELSKSGEGIHLHYIYTGDPEKLLAVYDKDIEVKVYKGNMSLRRKLTKCNNLPIATISHGLPTKGEDERKMVNFETLKNEKALRTLIANNLKKQYHASTNQSVDFIYAALEDAYNSGMAYDVSDMREDITAFAANSTNHASDCLKKVMKMHFCSEEIGEPGEMLDKDDLSNAVIFDCEVYPNYFLVCSKLLGDGKVTRSMKNPSAADIEEFVRKYKLIGFNNTAYDNHMLYARILGYDNAQLYQLSQDIIEKRSKGFKEAKHLSYTDIYDYCSKKQSLKKWEVELKIHHQEMFIPWDEDVPENMFDAVAEYCENDVLATEAVWNATQADFNARKILAELSGLTVNDSTNSHTTKIIFGNERHPELVYTDLSIDFPGYEFTTWKNYYEKHPEYIPEDTKLYENRCAMFGKCNLYRGTDLGFGGYVYAEPGIYHDVALLDVASLHPHSIKAMNCFGQYTKNFTDLMDVRIFVKHKDYESAKKLFGGKLAKFLDDPAMAKQLSQALKIAINSVYGLTSAGFDNPFKDPRNINNIVALRGALFMRTLQDEVQARGFTVAHIKTDSIKIPDATQEIIDFCMAFAQSYGYEFEHEATYDKICLVNNAVYIAKYKDGEPGHEWTATGTQFAVPYVFKTLFSHEDIDFDDLFETKTCKTKMHLNFNEKLPEGENNRMFIGKVGCFCPVIPGCGGALLEREATDKEGNIKYDAVVGTKGYRWKEAEFMREHGDINDIDYGYYDALVDDALKAIGKYGDADIFVEKDATDIPECLDTPPWIAECGRESCEGCPHLTSNGRELVCEKGCDVSDISSLNPISPF